MISGRKVLIDDCDAWLLERYTWNVSQGYVICSWVDGEQKTLALHRLILGARDSQQVDHANRNTLDNRRTNLRFCDKSTNGANRPAPRTNTSGVKGVNWDKQTGKWRAKLQVNGKSINIGRYPSIDEAKSAYNRAAKQHFGEFAWLNP